MISDPGSKNSKVSKKMSLSSQKYGFGIRDPGSGIRKNLCRIPDPGVKKAPDPGSGSAALITIPAVKSVKSLTA
jgi:hypothetical protein